MLRISKLTDYGTVMLAHLARNPGDVCSAADIAAETGIALPTTSKLLKALARNELVTSTRGANGGAPPRTSVRRKSSTRWRVRSPSPSAARSTVIAISKRSAASVMHGNG